MKISIIAFTLLYLCNAAVGDDFSIDFNIYSNIGKSRGDIVSVGGEEFYGSLLCTKNNAGFLKTAIYGFDDADRVNLILQAVPEEDLDEFDIEHFLSQFIDRFGYGYCIRIGADKKKGRQVLLPTLIWKGDNGYLLTSISFCEDEISSAVVRYIEEGEYNNLKQKHELGFIEFEELTSKQLVVLSQFNLLVAEIDAQNEAISENRKAADEL